MIKIRNKKYGERNDPNTILASQPLNTQLIVGAGNKGIKSIELPANAILVVDENSKVRFLEFSYKYNTVIAINYNGELELIPREELL